MSDPAIEAAQRAWDAWQLQVHTSHAVRAPVTAAAREALKPLRELHRPIDAHGSGGRVCHTCWDSRGDYMRWPCSTAQRIYTSDELA